MVNAMPVVLAKTRAASRLLSVSPGEDRRPANGKSTPEFKARKVLMLERARQQTLIRQMEAVRAEVTILESVLIELLSDPAFVALLRRQGFVTMPRALHERLTTGRA